MEGYQIPHGGPIALGARFVAAGTYTDIVAIYGPSEAEQGDRVDIRVDIKNKATFSIWVASLARVDGLDLIPAPEYASVSPGAIQSFNYTFIMGGKDVTFRAWSYYWTGTEWWQDDELAVTIRLRALPSPQFGGFAISDYSKR